MNATRMLAVNELGSRVGEDHHRAKLTNREVDRLLELHEEQGYGYKRLASMFAVSVRTVRDICGYRRRAQHATSFVRAAAPTIDDKREVDPTAMGPTFGMCDVCFDYFPYRYMQVRCGHRLCEECHADTLKYVKTPKNRNNPQQTTIFSV